MKSICTRHRPPLLAFALPLALLAMGVAVGCSGSDDPVLGAADAGGLGCGALGCPDGALDAASDAVADVTQPPDGAAPDGPVDASCGGAVACPEVPIPSGCVLGVGSCANGIRQCPPVVCPDAGPDASADSGGDAGPDASVDSGGDASRSDAGGFVCDSGDGSPVTCENRTQVCHILEGGVAPGIHAPSCIAFPAACKADRTCACLKTAANGNLCTNDGGNFTITQQVP